jgi:hypothetical protein
VDGAKGITSGGVFIGGNPASVGEMTGAHTAGGGLVVVVFVLNGGVGHVALLLFARHVTEHGVRDLVLVELGLAGAVEITGGLAEFLAGGHGEVVEVGLSKLNSIGRLRNRMRPIIL